MKAGVRYWLMVAVLLGATTGMAHLSHGESTPPAKPLSRVSHSDWPLRHGDRVAAGQRNARPPEGDRLSEPRLLGTGHEPDLVGSLHWIFPEPAHRRDAFTRPRIVCLAQAGIRLQSTVYQLPLDDGRKVPINLYIIAQRSGSKRSCCTGTSRMAALWPANTGASSILVYDALRLNRTDAALVRITVPVENGDEADGPEAGARIRKTNYR